ncbi:MAG: DUF362 domain-containing protein [Chitinivibrionales bacterium]|nr:DUF362 domain-containing protein [Chitinivibrionales bacterium]MBD3395181.1 DUF362 domain-containing protein [Chitinivibrionales bacterium]
MTLAVVEFRSYEESVREALDNLHASGILEKQQSILVKPNLICNAKPPVTTPVRCCEAIVKYVRSCSDAKITIAEGCGEPGTETSELFDILGYSKLARNLNIDLVDLNTVPVRKLRNADNRVFQDMYLPKLAFESFIISVPVLKAHSIAAITGSLKNMMGFAPPSHYGKGGFWKKAAFHARMHEAIVELNRFRGPDLSVMDASIGLAEYHLGGRRLRPPANRILAGFDPLDLDRKAAELLGLDWRDIGHLSSPLQVKMLSG